MLFLEVTFGIFSSIMRLCSESAIIHYSIVATMSFSLDARSALMMLIIIVYSSCFFCNLATSNLVLWRSTDCLTWLASQSLFVIVGYAFLHPL